MAPAGTRWSNWLLFALFLGGASFFLVIVWDYVMPVLLGVFTSVVFIGLDDWLLRKLPGRRRLAALLSTLGVVVAILLPLGFLATLVVEQTLSLLSYARIHLGQEGLAQLWAGRLPPHEAQILQRILGKLGQSELEALISNVRAWLAGAAASAFAFTSRTLLNVSLYCLATYYGFADGRRLLGDLVHMVPLEERHAREFLRAFGDVAGAVLFGMTAMALLHGVAGAIGYFAAGVPHALIFVALQVAGAFVPVIGTAIIWIPVGVGMILAGRLAGGIFLLSFMGVVSVALENLVRPQLIRGRMALHPFLLLLSVIGGLSLFGFAGFLVGPLAVSLLTAVVRIYRRDFVGLPPLSSPRRA
ncbi:MAG TPA: AI-2E family transporter [Myxococcales bacterium]|nr:AI-2E family transporter [Myxococcales bacterium]